MNCGAYGITITIIGTLLTGFNNIINEKFKNKYDFNNTLGYNTFIVYVFIFIDMVFSIIITPFIILGQYLINSYHLTTFDNFNKIIIYSSIIGIFYGPYYIIITKSYLNLSSITISIINNIVLIFTIFFSIILNLSNFNYLYIPAIILIFISSLIIVYKSESLKNNIIIK